MPNLRRLDHPYVLLPIATAFWGANSLAAKLALDDLSPLFLNAARWALGGLLLWSLARQRIAADWPVLRARSGYFLAMGAIGFTGFSALNYLALQYTSVINTTIEQSSMPAMVMVGAYLVFGSAVRPLQIVGVLVCVAGVAYVALHGRLTALAALDVNIGDALMLIGCLVYSGFSVFLRLKPKVHAFSLMVGFLAGATLGGLPLALVEALSGRFIVPTPFGLAVLAFIVVFPTIIGQAFFVRGVELMGASRAGIFFSLVPIFGSIFAVMFAGEQFETYHMVGLVLTLGGIALAEGAARPGRSAPPKVAVRPQSVE